MSERDDGGELDDGEVDDLEQEDEGETAKLDEEDEGEDEDEDDEGEIDEPYREDGGEMKQLVEYIARAVVSHPDQVVVSEAIDERRHVIRLDVAESDMGKVIGRGGRVAEAMRSLLKVAAVKGDTRVVLDIGD